MSGINDGEELTPEAIDLIIASGDPDAIENAMNQVSQIPAEIDVASHDSSIVAAIDTVENNIAQSAESAVVVASQSQAGPAGVSTKNGDGIIPFEVLTQTREQLSLAQQSEQTVLAENADLKAQVEENTRLLALNKTHFESNNLDVPVLPEHEKIDLENLVDYGDIGNAVRILAQQNEQMRAQLDSQPATVAATDSQAGSSQADLDDTHAQINANPALKQLFNDPATNQQVVDIDNALLKSHPHLSMADRFALVVQTHNQNIDALVASKTLQEKAVPASMSDASGETFQPETTGYDRLLGVGDVQQAAELDSMSDAALDKLLNEL